ncbi:g10989 [Coccomyxa elongata]
MNDSPFKGSKPHDTQVRGDFDALLSVSPREGPAQHHIPLVLPLRKRNSFKPQGSLDSAASFVSAASSASEPDTVQLVPAEEQNKEGSVPRAATSSVAADAVQLAAMAGDNQIADSGTAPTFDAQSNPKSPNKASGQDSDHAALNEEHRNVRTGSAEPLVPGRSLNGTKDTDRSTSSQMQGFQQKGEQRPPSAAQQFAGQANKPSLHTTSASDDVAHFHLGASIQPEHDDPLRCTSRATNSTCGHATSGATEASDDKHEEGHPDMSAPLQQSAVHESGSLPQQSPNDNFEEAVEAMQLQPRASAELPVSTIRAARCLSGYASAEDEPPHTAREATNSSGTFSATEHELLAAALRAGQAGGPARAGINPNDDTALWQEHEGTTDEGRLRSSAEGPKSSSWKFTDGMAAEGLSKGSDDGEGQELSALRGSSQEADQASAEGSSPDSHAAASYELHSIARDSSVTAPLQADASTPLQESVGRRKGSDVGTSGEEGDLEDDFSVVDASEAASCAAEQALGKAAEAGAGRATSLGRAASSAAAEVGQNEDSSQWRSQRKHFFVLSNAGRPVFTAHGSEHALAGFMAIIDAMMSFVKDRGDSLHSIRAGKHLIVFFERGPLYLVAVSSAGEPESALKLQLDLLHAHLLAILTDNFDRMLAKNPRFEPRRLLGGTEDVLRRFLGSFDSSPSAMLCAFEPLRLAADARHTVLLALQSAVKRSEAVYGVLLAGERMVGLAQPRAHALHAEDLLLLSSFVLGSDSFRAAAESFSPICLPRFNPSAFLHAYVHYLDPESGVCLVLLSSRQDAFHRLSDSAARLQRQLAESGVPQAIERALEAPGQGRLHIPSMPAAVGGGAFGSTALQHFLYKAPARGQYVMPAFAAPLTIPELQQEVMPAYARVHAAMFGDGGDVRQRVHFTRDNSRVALAYTGAEYEVYAQFDTLLDRNAAVAICQRLCAWIKGQHAELFVPLSL